MKAYEEDDRGTEIVTDNHKSVTDTDVPQAI